MSAKTIKTFTEAELSTLSITWRNILTAHHGNGQSYLDIAKDNNIPIGTVKSRINRARAKIAKLRERAAPGYVPPFVAPAQPKIAP